MAGRVERIRCGPHHITTSPHHHIATSPHRHIPTSRGAFMNRMHEVDYKIIGEDLQFVEIELDPSEAAVAEAGGMMYMEDGIEMETIFGDGSQSAGSSGFLGALMGAG